MHVALGKSFNLTLVPKNSWNMSIFNDKRVLDISVHLIIGVSVHLSIFKHMGACECIFSYSIVPIMIMKLYTKSGIYVTFTIALVLNRN